MFDGPQVITLLKDKNFDITMECIEICTWEVFTRAADGFFLGINEVQTISYM